MSTFISGNGSTFISGSGTVLVTVISSLIGDLFATSATKPCPVGHGRFHLASSPFTAKTSPLGELMTDCWAEVKLGL